MKKIIFTFVLTVLLAVCLVSCGNNINSEDTDTPNKDANETIITETQDVLKDSILYIADEYKYFKAFTAPQGDYREIVYNYMLSMANYTWVAGEDFSITWKNEGDFKVNLDFKKGNTYYGLPYSEQRASLDQFSVFCENGGTFTFPTYYYEELVGNHCSSSMGLAYQQLIDFPYAGSLKPVGTRRGVIKLIDGLEQPDGDTTKSWYSEDVISLNGKEKIFEAYANMGRGDILGKFIKTSGHSRMVSKVEIAKSASGKILPSRSLVYTIEQTNAFDKINTNRNTTWWIDHAYSFQELLDTKFIPLTLEIFYNGNELEDAYIALDTEITPESILKSLNGTVSSNFPISYVRATVTDADGNIVGEFYRRKFDATYKVNLRQHYTSLNIKNLQAGTYTFSLKAGIARGGFEIEKFDFTVN